jgi:hypothetical protein
VMKREKSTLSPVLRDSWDGSPLGLMTRADPLWVTGAHVSMLGHITAEELAKTLDSVEIANGLANRFLFVCAKRSKLLPEGGALDPADVMLLRSEIKVALQRARKIGLVTRDAAARERWDGIYRAIPDRDGLAGAITARAEAQLLRLTVVYTIMAGTGTMTVAHLESALAVWDYCERSAMRLFHGSGHPTADKLLAAIVAAGAEGLDGRAQHNVFGGNVPSREITAARAWLLARQLISVQPGVSTGGRPREIACATHIPRTASMT